MIELFSVGKELTSSQKGNDVTKDIARTVKTFFETYPLQTFGKGDKLVQTEDPSPVCSILSKVS